MKQYIFLIFLLAGTALFSCKKNKDKEVDNRMIQSFSGFNYTTNFLYDDQSRLIRIDYNATHSARFEYNATGVIVKYFEGAGLDPSDRYEFIITNGKVISCRRFLTGGNIWDLFYGYDSRQRLSEIGIRESGSNGQIYQRYDCYFAYDAQNNMHEVKLNGARGAGAPSDSIVITSTYYENKSFFTFRDIGFDYFGTVAVGLEYLPVLAREFLVPFPFVKRFIGTSNPSTIYPSAHPIKAWSLKGRAMVETGSFAYTFSPVEFSSGYNENVYEHDQQGKLVKTNGYTVVWQ